MATSSASSPPELGKKRHATLTDQDMEDILKKRNAANTDKVTGNSVNIIRKYLNVYPLIFRFIPEGGIS